MGPNGVDIPSGDGIEGLRQHVTPRILTLASSSRLLPHRPAESAVRIQRRGELGFEEPAATESDARYEGLSWPSPAQLAERALDAALWSANAQTHVRVELPGCTVWVLAPTTVRGPECPLGEPLHLLTACDPASLGDPCRDALRMVLLREELAGERTFDAVGFHPAGGHREASLAVAGLTDREATSISLRFGQVGIFSWDGPHWAILSCASKRRTHRYWTLVRKSA